MSTTHSSVMTASSGGLGARAHPADTGAKAPRSHWLKHVVRFARDMLTRRPRTSTESQEPIFRIAEISDDRWIVERPGAVIEHAFPDLEQAVAFVRSESATPATVELRIGDLYVVARYDPSQPGSLFGEANS